MRRAAWWQTQPSPRRWLGLRLLALPCMCGGSAYGARAGSFHSFCWVAQTNLQHFRKRYQICIQ